MPDVFSILLDGPIAGELANRSNVVDYHGQPFVLVLWVRGGRKRRMEGEGEGGGKGGEEGWVKEERGRGMKEGRRKEGGRGG